MRRRAASARPDQRPRRRKPWPARCSSAAASRALVVPKSTTERLSRHSCTIAAREATLSGW